MEPMTPFDITMAAGGAAIGAYTGSFFSTGMTNATMIASGAVIGGYGGYKLGRMIAAGDKAGHADATTRALTAGTDGELHAWRNVETGHTGFVRTVGAYKGTSGETCRQFRAGAALDREILNGEGIACQTASGQWRIMHDDLG